MITSANYFDEIETIIDRLPSEVKDAHNLVVAMKNDGIDDPFNTDDDDINDMGKLLLEKANAILAKSEKPRGIKITKPKAEKPATKPVITATYYDKADDGVGKIYKGDDGEWYYVFENGEIFECTDEAEPMYKTHRNVKLVEKKDTKPKAEPKRDTAILKKYNWDENHPIMILNHDSPQWKKAYDEFISYIKKNPKGKSGHFELIEAKKPATKKAKKRVVKKRKPSKKGKTISKKTAQKITRKAIKQTRKSDAAKPSVTKKIFSKELQIVKAFIANDGKEVSVGVLKAKHAAAKNAVRDGKTNQHQDTLRNIIVRYGKAIGAIKGTATHIKCNVEKGFLLKLKAIVADAKVKVRTDFLGGVGYKPKADELFFYNQYLEEVLHGATYLDKREVAKYKKWLKKAKQNSIKPKK